MMRLGSTEETISIDHYHHLSFLDTQDELEAQINDRYMEVGMHVLRQVFEELVQLFEKWEAREYIHRVYPFWVNKKFATIDIATVCMLPYNQVLSDLRSYKPEWAVYDWCWSKDGELWLSPFGVEAADFIQAAKDFAFEERKPGVTESWLRVGAESHLPRKLQTNIFNYKKKARRKLEAVHATA